LGVMNKKQKIVLWTGILIFIFLCLGIVKISKISSFSELGLPNSYKINFFSPIDLDSDFAMFVRTSLILWSIVIAGIFSLKSAK
jgi:hypothetical protein